MLIKQQVIGLGFFNWKMPPISSHACQFKKLVENTSSKIKKEKHER